MKKFLIATAGAATLLATATPASARDYYYRDAYGRLHHHKDHNGAAGAIIGGILGAVVGSAITSNNYNSYGYNAYPSYGYSYGYRQPAYGYGYPSYGYSYPSYGYSYPTYNYGYGYRY